MIYIDGNHHSDNVLRDARNSFKLLNKNGFIVFDDFLWDYYNEINLNPIGGVKQFLMYLPDYETTDSLLLGIDSAAMIQNVTSSVFANKKPIVFYGTSIVQGASAMRSGMAYPAIIERGLQRETINLGFSGNGLLDSMLAVIMSHIDAACYVIDCGPNLTPAMAAERTLPFLKLLRQNNICYHRKPGEHM